MPATAQHVRKLTYADILDWIGEDGLKRPEPMTVYLPKHTRRHGLTITPATMTVRGLVAVYLPRDERTPDGDPGCGYKVSVDLKDMFGRSTSGAVYTTAKAQAVAGGQSLLDTSQVCVDDPDGEEIPLMPVYGSQVTLSVNVKGVAPDDLQERALAALKKEFGDDLSDLHKIQTRPVADVRVDVRDSVHPDPDRIGPGPVIAVGILESEVHYLMRGNGVQVEEANEDVVLGR